LELDGWAEAAAYERFPGAVAEAVDVEVAERDQVAVELVGVLGPVGQPFGDRAEFANATFGLVFGVAVEHVQRHQRERFGVGGEADGVGRPGELAVEPGADDPELFGGDDDLADKP
jgi:hypothetical protein